MASSSAPRFQLNSTQTALAFILPDHLQSEIDSLRKIHDKAYSKWKPHINILYPFVEPSVLPAAVSTLREILLSDKVAPAKLNTNEVGVFRHRKNATVFLKPCEEAEQAVCQMRRVLVGAMGCDESEGTRDGTFRPHLSVGQAGLNGNSLERLMGQVGKLAKVSWIGNTLAVLRRQPSGQMQVIEELRLGLVGGEESETHPVNLENMWKPCFHLNPDKSWAVTTIPSMSSTTTYSSTSCIQILTYNIMAEPLAPSLGHRLPLIIEAIKAAKQSSDLHVLNLQEVDVESLPLILGHPFILSSFPFSTHTPSTLLPSHRNLITLASGAFRYHRLPFAEHHKSALIVSFYFFNVDVANIHLTSSLNTQALKSKMDQMNALTAFMSRNQIAGKTSAVAGDFNLTSSSRTIDSALAKGIISFEVIKKIETVINPDIWDDLFDLSSSVFSDVHEAEYDGEEGATFDRLQNPLAALTDSPIENRPERYDRLLILKGTPITPIHFEIIGFPAGLAGCGSDHYGLSVIFQINRRNLDQWCSDEIRDGISAPGFKRIEVIEDAVDIQPFLSPYLPTDEDRKQRQQAITLLETTLKSMDRSSNIILAPLGSYLMETYFPESDVDLLVIGSVPSELFFDVAVSKLTRLDGRSDNGFRGMHIVNSLVSIIEVWVSGIKFDLQYCEAPQLVNRFHGVPVTDLNSLVFDEMLISSLPPASIRPLNTYRDSAYLLKSISGIPSYRAAHRYLSLYLKRRGLYSAKFGYLGGIHLSLMLNRVTKLMTMASQDSTAGDLISVGTLIRTFLSYYASFNWAMDNVTDPSLPNHQNISRLIRDAVLIQSIHLPTARKNVASSCSELTTHTLTMEFKLACEKLKNGDWNWCLRQKTEVVQDFFNDFGSFISVKIDIWDFDAAGGIREMIGTLESRFPRFLVSLGRINGLAGRIWPERFCEDKNHQEKTKEQGIGLSGCYLIGISARDRDMDPQQKKLFSGRVIAAVREFESMIQVGKMFQAENTWISMNLVPRKGVEEMNLIIDDRDWGIHERKIPEEGREQLYNNFDPPSTSSTTKKYQRSPGSKLRPAQDILSRITWDPSLAAHDFLIGYEDRFIGVKEMELGKWKSEQTDEEFIPMHRIVWIRKKDAAGGEKVWDRKEKLDLIFGSGISPKNS